MDDRWMDSIEARIVRIEEKVDTLLAFRGWILGAGAAISAAISIVISWWNR